MTRKILSTIIGIAFLLYLFMAIVGVFFADGGSLLERITLGSVPVGLGICFAYVSHICQKCLFLSTMAIAFSGTLLGVLLHAIMNGSMQGDISLLLIPFVIYVGVLLYMIFEKKK